MRHLILILLPILTLAGCGQPLTPGTLSTPVWTPWLPLRNASNLGPIISDVESHLPAGHPYRDGDRVTWVHEGTHGIANHLRNRFHCPSFYALNNRAVLMREPAGTLADVATVVPLSLRGRGYQLYLVQQQSYFNGQPTYIFDEWMAYTNGSETRLALGIRDRQESVVSMIEFLPYALCVPYATRCNDRQMQLFIAWQIERSLVLRAKSNVPCPALDALRTAADAEPLRQFARLYFGAPWTKRTLGF